MKNKQFNEKAVFDTLQSWCDAVVAVGKAYIEKKDVKKLAEKLLSDAYDYDKGKVLFKPTLAYGEHTFRPTKEGALAYFIGNNKKFPSDKGFLLKPWVKVWYDKVNYVINDNIAAVQCNMHFISRDDNHIFVNKSFVFKICSDNKIRIILHQSSLPFTA